MMGRSLPDTPMPCSCQATREPSWQYKSLHVGGYELWEILSHHDSMTTRDVNAAMTLQQCHTAVLFISSSLLHSSCIHFSS